MASDLLVFYPQGRHLYIEFMGAKYIERQPKTAEEARIFMDSVGPVVKQLDDYVEKHGLKEIIELNLKGVPISKLNSESATHLLKSSCARTREFWRRFESRIAIQFLV